MVAMNCETPRGPELCDVHPQLLLANVLVQIIAVTYSQKADFETLKHLCRQRFPIVPSAIFRTTIHCFPVAFLRLMALPNPIQVRNNGTSLGLWRPADEAADSRHLF